jgi:circadian clock protein KaiC
MHLLTTQKLVDEFGPALVVMDPMTDLSQAASPPEIRSLVVRMIDSFKMNQTTALFTNLTHGGDPGESTNLGISSLMDTWILLSDVLLTGERSRTLTIIKSRGMKHSTKIQEFHITDQGIELGCSGAGSEQIQSDGAKTSN